MCAARLDVTRRRLRALDEDSQRVARSIFRRLVTDGDQEPFARRRVERTELDAEEDDRVPRVLATLVERRLLVADDSTVELVHEALIEQWPRLAGWLEEDSEGRRLHRHLTRAATEWAYSKKNPSELYRGARLAAALEWADAQERTTLNRLEREFLDESSAIATLEAERQRRTNKTLRRLLAAAIALLLGALAAGAVALDERGTARSRATAAIAQRLGAQALSEPQLDRALLLAREGVALDDTVATRSNLLASLLRSPAALAVLHGGGTRVVDDTLSVDGRLLAAHADDGSVSFFDTHSFRALSPRFHGAGGPLVRWEHRASVARARVQPRRTHACRRRQPRSLTDADAHRRPDVSQPRPARLDGSRDSRRHVRPRRAHAGYRRDDDRTQPGAARGARRAAGFDGSVLLRSRPIPGGRLVGFVLGGRDLLVTSGEPRSFLLDPRTVARTRTIGISSSAAISSDGTTAAFGGDDGSLTLVFLRSDRELALNGRAPGRVTALGFSRDGRLLASGADDGTVEVWDVATRTLRAAYKGHAAAAISVLFDHAGATLYSASSDGSVIVWDVAGKRRLGRPFWFSSLGRGAATAVAASPDSSYFVTSPAPTASRCGVRGICTASASSMGLAGTSCLPRVEPRWTPRLVYGRRAACGRLGCDREAHRRPVRAVGR